MKNNILLILIFLAHFVWGQKNIEKTDQIKIAGEVKSENSISCNLAEGSGRTSEGQQNHFYQIAYASALEVVSLLIVCNDLEMLADEDYGFLRNEMEKVTWAIYKLMPPPNQTSGRGNEIREPDPPHYGPLTDESPF